ncbi:MAG: hypothetical protein COA79_10250 [Planctomycetota bacterium]|nr:MAG: hypothetical protein COA79_10250 [Planctomycetota bacterium]
MSNSFFKTSRIILKYSFKRMINKFGYVQSKGNKKNKSRKAVGKKKNTVTILVTFLMVIGMPLIIFNFLNNFNNQLVKLNNFQELVENQLIPSKSYFPIDYAKEKKITPKVKKEDLLSREDFKKQIHKEFLRMHKQFNFDLEKAYLRYEATGQTPFAHVDDFTFSPLSIGSPYMFILSLGFGFCIFYSLFTNIGLNNKDLGAMDKYLEWLSSMPIKINHLYLIRIFENSFANGINLVLLLPVTVSMYVVVRGVTWIPFAVLVWLFAVIAIGSMKVLFELYFQHYGGLGKAKVFQALSNILGVVFLFAVYLASMKIDILQSVFTIVGPYKSIIQYIPLFHLPYLSDSLGELISLFILAFFSGGLMVLTYFLSYQASRKGLISQTTSNIGTRKKTSGEVIKLVPSRFDPYVQLELKMLLRNKQILITTIGLPLLLFTYYYFIFDFESKSLMSPVNVTLTAFALSSYLYLFTNYKFVQREGLALWFILVMPIDPTRYFFKKVFLWSSFSFAYVFFLLGYYCFSGGELSLLFLVNAIAVLIGVGLFGSLSTSIGLLGSDPLKTNESDMVNVGYAYLYMLFCSMYASGLYIESYYTKFAIITVIAGITVAIKSKVRRRLEYFLDPVAVDSKLGMFEGLLFIAIYFFIQTVTQLIVLLSGEKDVDPMLGSFIGSGVLILVLLINIRYYPEMKKVFIDLFPQKVFQSPLLKPLVLSFSCIAFAGIYLLVIKELNLFNIEQSLQLSQELSWRVIIFVVLIAPFTEEILFRRVLFHTMLKEYKPVVAILFSSLLFGFVHPLLSFIPVFILGCATAYTYYKTKNIYASILVHSVYNAGAIGLNVLLH